MRIFVFFKKLLHTNIDLNFNFEYFFLFKIKLKNNFIKVFKKLLECICANKIKDKLFLNF